MQPGGQAALVPFPRLEPLVHHMLANTIHMQMPASPTSPASQTEKTDRGLSLSLVFLGLLCYCLRTVCIRREKKSQVPRNANSQESSRDLVLTFASKVGWGQDSGCSNWAERAEACCAAPGRPHSQGFSAVKSPWELRQGGILSCQVSKEELEDALNLMDQERWCNTSYGAREIKIKLVKIGKKEKGREM